MVHETLQNGLEVFVYPDRRSPIFRFCIFYKVGSMDEHPGITGASHFVEHMRFKGNTNLKGPEIDAYVKRHGGSIGGATDDDSTFYYMELPSSQVEYPFIVESQLMFHAEFDTKEFETERGVIIEERRTYIDDSPVGSLFEAFKSTAFKVHPYRFPVSGWMKDIANISRDEAYDFYRSYYRSDNAFIIVVGDVNTNEIIEYAHKYFGGIPRPEKPVKRAGLIEPPQNSIRRTTVHKQAELPIIMMGFHSPNLKNPDIYPLIVAEKILSSGRSSRIYRNIIHNRRMATRAGGFFNYTSRDPGLFTFFAQASKGVNPDELEKALWEEAERICAETVSIEELEKAKNLVETAFVYRKEEGISEAAWRGAFHISHEINAYETFPERVREVTARDIQSVCAKIFTKNNATVAELDPSGSEKHGGGSFSVPEFFFYSASNKSRFTHDSLNASEGLPYWNDAEKYKLSNGIRVISYPRHEIPVFQIAVLVSAGSVYDYDGKYGLANLTANLLRAGTASRTSFDISSEIENIGGEFSISTHREYAILGTRILSRHRRIALDILSECLIYPSFLDEEVQRYRELACGEAQSVEDDTWSLTWREFNRLIFSGSTYAHPVLGEISAIDTITPNDVKNFHSLNHVSDNTIIVVTGDFDPDEIRDDLELYFKNMPHGGMNVPPTAELGCYEKIVCSRYHKNLEQASVVLGGALFPRKSPDFFAYLALDHILGYGGLTSRLYTKARTEKGLVYVIESSMNTMSRVGNWAMIFQTKNESVNETVNLVRGEMRRLRESPVTDAELNDFKTYIRGSSAFEIESNRGLAQKLLTIAYYDLGDDYLANFFKNVENVTKERIIEVARKYLNPDNFKLLIVGDEKLSKIEWE